MTHTGYRALLLPALVMLGFGGCKGVQRLGFVLNSEKALALVTGLDVQDTTCQVRTRSVPCQRYGAVVEFTSAGRKPVNAVLDLGTSRFSYGGDARFTKLQPGQTVQILYDKRNPFQVMKNNFATLWLPTIIPTLIGLIALSLAWVCPRH